MSARDELAEAIRLALDDVPDTMEATGPAETRVEISVRRAEQYVSPGSVRTGYTHVTEGEIVVTARVRASWVART